VRKEPSYENIYIQSYDENNSENNLAGAFLQKSHGLLEGMISVDENYPKVLEVGAGSGHHIQYVKHGYEQYVMSDGNDEMLKIASGKYADQIKKGNIVIEKQDATALAYEDNSFDRLIATHVLEHLPDPVSVLKEWNRVVRPGGMISIVLPCDPGMMWRAGRYLGPRRRCEKIGIAYDYMQAVEHINSIYNLEVLLRYHFDDISELWYPLRVPVPDLNLFYICNIRTVST